MTHLHLVPVPQRAASLELTSVAVDELSPHGVVAERFDVLPRGWPEAWVWTCRCGTVSDSIMRTPTAALEDHQTEHLNQIESENP